MNISIETVSNFIDNEENQKLVKNYELSQSNPFDIGFNVFHLSSDLYYRENFQSDIIAAFLNPKHSHNEQDKYLHLFIDFLNIVDNKKGINKSDFLNSQVAREPDRIDILITDIKSKKAIIIENKINNAGDTYRQLPTYVDKIKKQNYDIQAIVYITLESGKSPNKDGWHENEIAEIDTLLKKVSSNELYNNWIIPSIINSNNIDSAFILRQYGNLLKYLTSKNMLEKELLGKFYGSIIGNDKFKIAMFLKTMVDDLPNYIASRIEDEYRKKHKPFNSVKRENSIFFFIDYNKHNLEIFCSNDGYKVHLFNYINPTGYDILKQLPAKALEGFDYTDHSNKNSIAKRFDINSEKELFQFIDQFLAQSSQNC